MRWRKKQKVCKIRRARAVALLLMHDEDPHRCRWVAHHAYPTVPVIVPLLLTVTACPFLRTAYPAAPPESPPAEP